MEPPDERMLLERVTEQVLDRGSWLILGDLRIPTHSARMALIYARESADEGAKFRSGIDAKATLWKAAWQLY